MWKYEGKSKHAIAKELKVGRHNVIKLIEKYQKTGTVERQPGQGRKRKLSARIAEQMAKKARHGASAEEIARDYNKKQQEEGKKVSSTIVRKTLKAAGLRYLVREEKQELTTAQKTRRLAYAKKRRKFNWRPVLFTDEKTFLLGIQ